jgi:hypothetical protein
MRLEILCVRTQKRGTPYRGAKEKDQLLKSLSNRGLIYNLTIDGLLMRSCDVEHAVLREVEKELIRGDVAYRKVLPGRAWGINNRTDLIRRPINV